MNSIKDNHSLHDTHHHVELAALTDEDTHSAPTRQVPPGPANTKLPTASHTPPLLNKSLNLSGGDITVAAHDQGVINTQGYPLPPIVTSPQQHEKL